MNSFPFLELKSDRLLLRRITSSDVDMILFLRSDVEVNRFIKRAEKDKTKTKEDALKHIKMIDDGLDDKRFISWGICLLNMKDIVGTICLWNFSDDFLTGEIGYDLSPEFQKKGIMNEAMKMVLQYGFDTLKLSKIEAYTHRDNESSKALLLKNGFLLSQDKIDEDNVDNQIFQLLSPF